MVNILQPVDHEALHAAIKQAEHKTGARLHVTVHPVSDNYHDYALLYGMTLGSLIDLILWNFGFLTEFPPLLTLLLALALAFDLIPSLRFLCLPIIPRSVKHRRAARAAMNDFHGLQAHLPHDAPFILLFVSVGERYVHVVTNPVVHRALPGDWHKVTEAFAVSMKEKRLAKACVTAIDQIADLTAVAFPPHQ